MQLNWVPQIKTCDKRKTEWKSEYIESYYESLLWNWGVWQEEILCVFVKFIWHLFNATNAIHTFLVVRYLESQ